MKEKLFAPRDAINLTIFRVALSLGIVIDAIKSLMDLPEMKSAFKPKYFGFEWVELGAMDQIFLYAAMVLALILMSGFFSKLISAILFLVWTAFWLDDFTRLNNHYYMTSFVLLIFALFGCGGFLHQIKRKVSFTPSYLIFLIQMQICIVYFFGGVAKLHPDWMSGNIVTNIFDRFEYKHSAGMIYFITWGGLILDLACPFGFMFRRTRLFTLICVTGFHVSNMFIFGMQIGGFPYMMTVASVVFFSPEIVRKLLGLKLGSTAESVSDEKKSGVGTSEQVTYKAGIQFYFAIAYLVFQVLMPMRYWVYPGDVLWHRHGLFLTWRMMMSYYACDEKYAPKFRVSTPEGKNEYVYFSNDLGDSKAWSISAYPDLVHQYALVLESRLKKEKNYDPEIYAEIYVSLNGQPVQKLIDPTVDLTKERRRPWPAAWVNERVRLDTISLADDLNKELEGFWGNVLPKIQVEKDRKDAIEMAAKQQVAKFATRIDIKSRQISQARQAMKTGKATQAQLDELLKAKFLLVQQRDEQIYAAIPEEWRNNIFAFRMINAVGAKLQDFAKYNNNIKKYFQAAQKVSGSFLKDPELYYSYERFNQEVDRILEMD